MSAPLTRASTPGCWLRAEPTSPIFFTESPRKYELTNNGTAFSGSTTVDLSLAEINPALARDIEILLAEIAKERKALVANAPRVERLAETMELL